MTFKSISIVVLIVIIVLAFLYLPNALRVYKIINLHDKDSIAYNYINMQKFFDKGPMLRASENPHTFPKKEFKLPSTYEFEGKVNYVDEALEYFETDGLIVLKDGNMLYENYWHNNSKDTQHISWSVAKSFLSALIGITYERGLIEDLNDPIEKYLPDFIGTGYEGVAIKHLLQMSSGIKFNEDYADFNSDINRFGRVISSGTSMRDFAKTLKNEKTTGTYHHYVSIDTQMLAMLLVEITGKSITENLQEIWTKIGMESDAFYMVDDTGMEVALGGLNATLRDYAKFGQLYLNKGNWNGEQVVPEFWVDASHYPDEDHLVPGDNPNSSDKWGYGYQWWVPGFPDTDYMASGIYNQYIYVNPELSVVIAKISSNYKFPQEKQFSKDSHVALFRAIANSIE